MQKPADFNQVKSYYGFKYLSSHFLLLVVKQLALCWVEYSMNKVAKPNGLLHWHKLLYSLFFCLSFAILHPKITTLTEIAFQKVFTSNTLKEVMKMLFFIGFFMTIASLTGLFTSGNWRDLEKEMGEYRTGRLSFVRKRNFKEDKSEDKKQHMQVQVLKEQVERLKEKERPH